MSVGAGYLVGRANTPKWDDPTNSPALIRQTVGSFAEKKIADDWVIELDDQHRLVSFRPRVKTLSFRCGALPVQTYDPTKPAVERGPADRPETTEMPRLGFTYTDTLGFLVGGAEMYSLKGGGQAAFESWASLTAREAVEEKIRVAVAAVVMSGIGFGLGYYIGYDDQIQCGEPLFQKLLDDRAFWSGVESDFVSDHHWMFEYLNPGRDTSHDFDGWPESVRPSSSVIDDEQKKLSFGSHLVRVHLMSRMPIGSLDLHFEADRAHVYGLLPNSAVLSPVSFRCNYTCRPRLK